MSKQQYVIIQKQEYITFCSTEFEHFLLTLQEGLIKYRRGY
jgi:hypothetical protein